MTKLLTSEDLGQVYTVVAYPTSSHYLGQTGILFQYNNDYEPTLQDRIDACALVVNHVDDSLPLVAEILGDHSLVVTPVSNHVQCLEDPDAKYVRYDPETKRISLAVENDNYYTCPLPQKHIQGCATCTENVLNGEKELTDRHCKTLHLKALTCKNGGPYMRRGDWSVSGKLLRTLLKGRKNLGDYTCIPPAWTTDANFAKLFREPDEHSFDYKDICDAREELSRRATQGNKVKSWLRENCHDCVVKVGCKDSARSYDRSRCSQVHGAYHYSEQGVTDKILANSIIPYTDAQLRVLLVYSGIGDLPKRHERYIIVPTFRTSQYHPETGDYLRGKEVLRFVFVQRTSSDYEAIVPKTFKEVMEVLSEKMDISVKSLIRRALRRPKVTAQDKVMLMVMASTRYSPCRSNGFGPSQYPVLSVKRSIYYGDNRWSLALTMSKGQHAYWDENFKDINDVYSKYRMVPLLPERMKGD